jgi:hypothetical protein
MIRDDKLRTAFNLASYAVCLAASWWWLQPHTAARWALCVGLGLALPHLIALVYLALLLGGAFVWRRLKDKLG